MPRDQPDERGFIRHDTKPEKPFEFAAGDTEKMDAICAHFASRFGEATHVFHEVVSNLAHIDVHIIPPEPGRDFCVLFTTGMSDRPMSVPEGAEEYRYAELFMKLPADWPDIGRLTAPDRKPEVGLPPSLWPVHWLKALARFPHEFDSWFGPAHTLPNGDPPMPLAPGTELCCFLFLPPLEEDEAFDRLELPDRTINIYNAFPIYKEEMMFKIQMDAQTLLGGFQHNGITDVVQPNRTNVVKKLLENAQAESAPQKTPKRRKRFGLF